MNETNTVHMELTATDRASAVLQAYMAQFARLEAMAKRAATAMQPRGADRLTATTDRSADLAARAMKAQSGFADRMARQRAQEARTEERTRRFFDSDALRALRTRMRETQRLFAVERAGERDRQRAEAQAERDEAVALRRRIAGDRLRARERDRTDRQDRSERERARRTTLGRGRDALSSGRDLMTGFSRAGTLAAAVGGGLVAAAARAGLRTRGDADAAETHARIFADLSPEAVKFLRSTWGDKAAVRYGIKPGEALDAFVETIKAGVPREFSAQVSNSILGAVAGLDLDMGETTKLVGRLSTLTQDPLAFNPKAIDGMLNSIAVVAKSTAADSNEIVSGLRRGAGALGASKMSVADLSAFVGTGVSAGLQEGKAGTFLDYIVNELVGAKNETGKRRLDLGKAFNLLGLGGANGVSAQVAQDPTAILTRIFGRLEAMPEQRRAQVADLLGQREWRGEILQMTKAFPTLKQALADLADPANAKFLDKAAREKINSIKGLSSSLRTVSSLAWESFGAGFEGLYREAVNFFIGKGSGFKFDTISRHVTAFLDGMRRGFDLSSWTEGFEKLFGGSMRKGGWQSELFSFGQGFAEGMRAIVDSIRSAASLFTGGKLDARSLGRWTSEFFALSFAARLASPVLNVLGSVGSMLTGLATAALAVRGLGLGSALTTGLGGRLAGGLRMGLAGVAAVAVAEIVSALSDKLVDAMRARKDAFVANFKDAFMGALDEAMNGIKEAMKQVVPGWVRSIVSSILPGGEPTAPSGNTTPPDPRRDGFQPWLTPRVQPQSFDGGALRDLLHPTGFRGGDGVVDGLDRLGRRLDLMGARFERVALMGPSSASAAIGGSASSGSTGGGGDPAQAFGKRFFTPRGMNVPGWYGGGGSGVTSPMLKGEAQANAKASYDFFRSKGLSHEAASGILASMKQESGFNPGARGDGGKAHGLFQHHPDRRAAIRAATGINMSNASLQDQLKGTWWEMNHGDAGAQRALKILQTPGISARDAGGAFVKHFERPAADERASRGAMAEGFARLYGAGGGAGIAGLGGAGQFDGLRVKGGQAVGGGGTHLGVSDLARQAQENLPGGVKWFSAFNDHFHQGTGSKHASGLAFDTSLLDPSKSPLAAEAMRAKLRAAGLLDRDFKVIDEYRNPSARSTGGHIHSQFNSPEAAQRYRNYISSLTGENAAGRLAKSGAGSWKAGAGGNADALAGKVPQTPDPLSRMPLPPQRPASLGGGAGSGGGVVFHVTNHIAGGDKSPRQIAEMANRHIQEAWADRAHDLEPELT